MSKLAFLNDWFEQVWIRGDLDQIERFVSEVQHLDFHRRVKWCSRIDGFGCDYDGEWHSHWSGVKHSDVAADCCYTVVLPIYPAPAKNHPKPDTTEEQK